MSTLAVRSEIPRISVSSVDGSAASLASLIGEKPTLLIFLRDAACVLAQAYLKELGQAAPQIAGRSLQLIAAVDADPAAAREILAPLDLPFPVLCNGSGELYDSFGVGKANSRDDLGDEGTMEAIRAAYAAGFVHGTDTGEPLRLPAWFLIDSSGRIAKAHYGKLGNDLPPTDALPAVLEQTK